MKRHSPMSANHMVQAAPLQECQDLTIEAATAHLGPRKGALVHQKHAQRAASQFISRHRTRRAGSNDDYVPALPIRCYMRQGDRERGRQGERTPSFLPFSLSPLLPFDLSHSGLHVSKKRNGQRRITVAPCRPARCASARASSGVKAPSTLTGPSVCTT